MNEQPSVVVHRHSANPKLWAVKAFLDLITRDEPLVHGDGLKYLYVLSAGLATYNDDDIRDATAKAEAEGYLPLGLHNFMMASIIKNCGLYATMLQGMIEQRIVHIANGSVANPEPALKYSNERARRHYYLPPFPFLQRVQKAVRDDVGDGVRRPIVTRIQDVANEAEFLLSQIQGSEGYITPQQSSFKALQAVVSQLVTIIELERPSNSSLEVADYRVRARGALKIVWFIAKLLMGDLTVLPDRKDLAVVDLEARIRMSDGTLASLPFPTPETISLFADRETHGVSMKGRTYLAAASLAAFDRSPTIPAE